MFGLFKRGTGKGGVTPSLDALGFDTTGYESQGEPLAGKLRVWHTPEGDGLGIYFFPMSPYLPTSVDSVDALASFYRQMLGDSGGKLIEAKVVVAGLCPATRTLISVPQQPSGRTCVGSITVPFRDFSFVIKCQCVEGGPTGLKAALLLDRSLAVNELTIEGERFHIPGFDPDDPKHDAEFPNDPVARARRVLAHIIGSLVISAEIRKLPGFALPQEAASSLE